MMHPPVILAARFLSAFALTLVSLANSVDNAVSRRLRRRAAVLAAALLLAGCASAPRGVPEPPRIDRLNCGGKSCTITTSGSATIVWVQE